MYDPHEAIHNWLRILKPGGYLICLVPDEDLYEQGVFPSTFNPDHKHTFTIYKKKSWSASSISLFTLLSEVKYDTSTIKIELLDATYRYNISRLTGNSRFDQTLTPIGECAIEFIILKA
jgi:SAM-dependent methyltransferase